MDDLDVVLKVKFYRTDSGNEPVQNWLKQLMPEQRKLNGEDIKAVQFGWPLGMPLVRKLEPDLWEVRSFLPQGISRVIFTVIRTTWCSYMASLKNRRRPRKRN